VLKKKHIIKLAENRLAVNVARPATGPHVQFEGGELVPIDHSLVLGGKAVSVNLRGALHLVHLSVVGDNGQLQATINGRPVQLTALDELAALNLESQTDTQGDGAVVADIPGLVVNLMVSEGQSVAAGEPVIVIEAMKMQNELTAGIAGIVSQIGVKSGQSVYPGDILLVITSEEAD